LPGSLQLQLSGIGAQQTRRTAEALVAAGAQALVSWGVAGGLAPSLQAGHLLLPRSVQVSPNIIYGTNSPWRQRLIRHLEGKLPLSCAALAHTEKPLASPGEKTALYRQTGCIAADMESAAIGEIAASANLPFLIIRAIADPAFTGLPSTALQALDRTGRLQGFALVTNLWRYPHEWLALWQLAGHFRAARTTLRALVTQLGPNFPVLGNA